MIARYDIETAYTFFHQKKRVYDHSTLQWQRDDIEVAITDYVDVMNPDLYQFLAGGRQDFLRDHPRFSDDITQAVEQLERLCFD